MPQRIQTSFDLCGTDARAAYALIPTSTDNYQWPGSALSASTRLLRFDLSLGHIVWARWVVIWNPQGDTNAGIVLVQMDAGPQNEQTIAEQTGQTSETPLAAALDVTEALESLRVAGVYKYLGHKIRKAPVVFQSSLDIVWEIG